MLVSSPTGSLLEIMCNVCHALEINADKVRRVILDFDTANEGTVMAYVEMHVTDKILDVDWTELEGSQIKILDKGE